MDTAVAGQTRRRLMTAILCLILLFGLLQFPASAEETTQTDAPNVSNCVVYNYDRSSENAWTPTLYMWNYRSETATLRAYVKTSDGITLIGTGRTGLTGTAIPLNSAKIKRNGGTIYITLQEDGLSESESVTVSYGKAADPGVQFNVYNFLANGGYIDAGWHGTSVYTPQDLKKGSYYEIDISLVNFSQIQSLKLPIKYDPTVLQLAKVSKTTVNGSERNQLAGTLASTDEAGFLAPVFQSTWPSSASNYYFGGLREYGIGITKNLSTWGGTQTIDATSTQRESPYINTTTGLIKLEFSRSAGPSIPENGQAILRLYFQCVGETTATQMSDIVHIATQADAPSGNISEEEARRYYAVTSPEGLKAGIGSINVLQPPPSTQTESAASEAYLVTLSQTQISNLPTSYSTAEQIRELIENQVRVYNYTNYGDGGDLPYGALDNADKVQDVLLLTPSSTANGAARQGDVIRVYGDDNGAEPIGGPVTVDSEGGVRILLGTNKLNPEGGYVYVTVARFGGTESARIAVQYNAEMSRDVTFVLNSSGAEQTATSLQGYKVKTGDQIRMDLYFNNFDDLMAYTFGLKFDPAVVQAADSDFNVLLQDGYIEEKSLQENTGCIAVGDDLAAVTVNEAIIYEVFTRYSEGNAEESELTQTAQTLGMQDLTLDEIKVLFAEIADRVALQYQVCGEDSWKGGLLFTGPAREGDGADDPGREEDTLYPYVSNTGGILRVSSISLVRPSLSLHRDTENGYWFLSAYFVAVANGDPKFSLDDEISQIVLAGPGKTASTGSTVVKDVSAMPYTLHWQIDPAEKIEKLPTIKLAAGNALESDNDSTAVYLYNGYAYRDPGYLLRDASGTVLENTQPGEENPAKATVLRYYCRCYTEDGVDKKSEEILIPWQKDEKLDVFRIGAGKYSAEYELIYRYTDSNGKTAEQRRAVYVLFPPGDLNGDGMVSVFDEQMIADQAAEAAAASDALYREKTMVSKSVLHNALMGLGTLEWPYTMPVEQSQTEEKEVEAEEDAFQLELEFYSAGSGPGDQPLSATGLPAGSKILVAVRYRNLHALSAEGMYNFAAALNYDPAHFSVNDFQTVTDTLRLWDETASAVNSAWVSEVAGEECEVSAVDRALEDGKRQIYWQYVNTSTRECMAFEEETGYLGVFSMTVVDSFTVEDAVKFCWADYALTTAEESELSRIDLLESVKFQKPQNPITATADAGAEGYSITGRVTSYNAKNPVLYELYRQNADGSYSAQPTYSGTAVAGAATTGTAKQQQAFVIAGISNGTYKLVVRKTCHLNCTIIGISVENADVDLTTSAFQSTIRNIALIAGDVDGNGAINPTDIALITHPNSFGKTDMTLAGVNVNADIDGNGAINPSDLAIATNPEYFGKTASGHCVFYV